MEGEYVPTIGLEIHAELKTRTKMFCDSKNDADEVRPNVNVCPVCMAHPGTLPVINAEAVRNVLKVGIALGSKLADYTEFDRKNYFYPDLPKGYQLSQYEYPLVSGGELAGVAITRVHLEEDTASSVHNETTGETSVDYNRAGVPLMELVTEPVITSAEQAGNFARELQLLLRTLGVSDANMEKGEMRVEANVSIGKKGELGTKVEIKNLNSFNAMERAVRYEVERQKELLSRGEKVVQQTLGWNDARQATFPQRIKEGSADYRYFPDPDLPSLKLSEVPSCNREVLKKDMPELPWVRRARYLGLGLKKDDVESFLQKTELSTLFEGALKYFEKKTESIQLAANYIANDIVSLSDSLGSSKVRDTDNRDTDIHNDIQISSENFNKIIELAVNKKISSRSTKDMLAAYMQGEQREPKTYVEEMGLRQEQGTDKLKTVVLEVLEKNAAVAADFRSGKLNALEYLVGQCMRDLKGAADPATLRELLKQELSRV